MSDSDIFLHIARQKGFSAPRARLALHTAQNQLADRGYVQRRYFYIYRTSPQGAVGGASSSERPRRVLAFATADTALGFAQHNHLRPTPRLLRASLGQLLAVLVQRSTIQSLLFVAEPLDIRTPGTLPAGFSLERAAVVHMLEEWETEQ
jgi:hypothetical protein